MAESHSHLEIHWSVAFTKKAQRVGSWRGRVEAWDCYPSWTISCWENRLSHAASFDFQKSTLGTHSQTLCIMSISHNKEEEEKPCSIFPQLLQDCQAAATSAVKTWIVIILGKKEYWHLGRNWGWWCCQNSFFLVQKFESRKPRTDGWKEGRTDRWTDTCLPASHSPFSLFTSWLICYFPSNRGIREGAIFLPGQRKCLKEKGKMFDSNFTYPVNHFVNYFVDK